MAVSETSGKRAAENWRHVLSTIGVGREAFGEGIRFAMSQIMSDASGDMQAATFVFGSPARETTAVRFDAAAEGILSFVHPVYGPWLADVIERGAADIVETGGDGVDAVNISMISMVIIVANGVPALKHDDRAISLKSGGADMLEVFGIDIEDDLTIPPEHPDFYIRFLFVAYFHPAMRFTGPVYKELAVPIAFNLLGPLTNPAYPQASLVGCAFEDQMETIANAFACRDQCVLVVRENDSLDEATATGPTKTFIMKNGEVTEDVIDPHDYDMKYSETDALHGGDPAYNADVAHRIWVGGLEGPIHDAVIPNSAAAIAVSRGLGGRSLKGIMADSIEEIKGASQSGLCLDILTAMMKG